MSKQNKKLPSQKSKGTRDYLTRYHPNSPKVGLLVYHVNAVRTSNLFADWRLQKLLHKMFCKNFHQPFSL